LVAVVIGYTFLKPPRIQSITFAVSELCRSGCGDPLTIARKDGMLFTPQ